MPISFPWAWKHDTIDIRGKWILEPFSQFHRCFARFVSHQAILTPHCTWSRPLFENFILSARMLTLRYKSVNTSQTY